MGNTGLSKLKVVFLSSLVALLFIWPAALTANTLPWSGGSIHASALEGATAFYFAEGTCRPNFDPYICIQNPGGEAAQVKITYMKGDGSSDEQALEVVAHSRSSIVSCVFPR